MSADDIRKAKLELVKKRIEEKAAVVAEDPAVPVEAKSGAGEEPVAKSSKGKNSWHRFQDRVRELTMLPSPTVMRICSALKETKGMEDWADKEIIRFVFEWQKRMLSAPVEEEKPAKKKKPAEEVAAPSTESVAAPAPAPALSTGSAAAPAEVEKPAKKKKEKKSAEEPKKKTSKKVMPVEEEVAPAPAPAPAPVVEAPVVEAPVVEEKPAAPEAPAATKEGKKKIPKHIKTLVWNKYLGASLASAKCMCCREADISVRSFDCGHVIAEAKGGDSTINNLRPICRDCNHAMGTRSMNDFTAEFFGWTV